MSVSAKGFSLVEILVVTAIVGIISTTGFMFLQNSLRDSRLQNEFTHAEQLLKKYAKQSLTSQAPIQINFSHNSPNTTALIYTMSEDDYSRFNKTDCNDIDTDNDSEHDEITENSATFNNVLIKACDGSIDINICFSGRGGITGEVIDEDFIDEAIDNGSRPTINILPSKKNYSCGFLTSVKKPNQRQLTLYSSGYIGNVSTATNFDSFNVESASFSDGGMMPDRFGCIEMGNGNNTQFNLSWNGFPADTEFFAIIMDDPGYTYVHWSVFNISLFDISIGEGGEIEGERGMNDDGGNDYYGPCPPSGTHTYVTSVYALSEVLDPSIADSPVTRAQFESGEFSSSILAKGTIISEYESN